MSGKAHISLSESAGVIECSGSVALAKLLHLIRVDTRARIVGVSAANATGVITAVIAGGLAEVQHATELVKTLSGVSDLAFFARPDKEAMNLLLKSLMITTEEPTVEIKKDARVREIEDLHISDIETWNVHELRRYARSLHAFPIKGRDISRATRSELLTILHTSGNIFRESTSPRAYPPANELRIVN